MSPKNRYKFRFQCKILIKYLCVLAFIVLVLYVIRRPNWDAAPADVITSTMNPKVPVDVVMHSRRPSPSDWKFETPKYYAESAEMRKWNQPIHVETERLGPGNGEDGWPFTRIAESDLKVQQLMKENGYNLVATEMMSLQRSLPDYRYPECQSVRYPSKLPAATFVMIFHNEAWSLIFRSIWSIINRSPAELIEEIILVDDVSTMPVLQRPIVDYIKLLPVPVRLIRTQKREGLIRARLIGAKEAKGSVLIFLDAHVEVNDGWLEPLLATIANDRSTVAVPHINWINDHDLSYQPLPLAHKGYIGLNWFLNFTWIPIPQRELDRTNGDRTAPLRITTQIGCAMAVDREFFYEIGTFDADMEIWGGENLEMSLRVWQCGGSLLLVPCSQIGHLFRIAAYSFNGDRNLIEHHNNIRIMEVWMDEYKKVYNSLFTSAKSIPPGNLHARQRLRERLQCKSFKWYLENINPESSMNRDFLVVGEIISVSSSKCLDTYPSPSLGEYDCHHLGYRQFFAFERDGQIVLFDEHSCISGRESDQNVYVDQCNRDNEAQRWSYDSETKLIRNMVSGLCFQNPENATIIALGECDAANPEFQWTLRELSQ